MKINYLKINAFGKLKNKEINLNNNINLIYGKNEAGKTTLLKFIYCMLYGISKNKNGKEISDFEKYKPWDSEEFSGKIKYELDNEDDFEVFRDFSKKNPKIYDMNLEDISKNFTIDKNKGNQFFYEQTKIDEGLFQSTTLVEQNNIVLDKNSQNSLTQKIANILSSGEDNISYKKVMNNLSKKLIEEVGTERTVDRPLNKVSEDIKKLKEIKEKLDVFENKKNIIKDRKNEINNELENLEKELLLTKEIKEIKQQEEKNKEKIKINNNLKRECEEKINNLKNKIRTNKNNKKNKNNYIINLFLISILIILNILINFVQLSEILQKAVIFFTIIYLLICLICYLIKKIKNNKLNNKINIEKIKIEKEIEVLKENKKNIENEIKKIEEEIQNKNNKELINLKNKYSNIINQDDIINLFNKNVDKINSELEYLNRIINNKNIELNTIIIEEKNINENLDKKIECDEQLEYLKERKKELEHLGQNINLAKQTIEESYNQMKNEITPKFTKNLSKIINNISEGKYKNVKFDPNEGLMIEKENGEYINCNNLSIGTIDQLYLSLRISSIQEISEEKMPIVLDESFAYFDNERLKNILVYLNEYYKDNQIIIFTCSNREKEILDKLNIEYNLINL